MSSRCLFDIENVKLKIQDLEAKTADPNFWNEAENSAKILKEIKQNKDKVENYTRLESLYEDIFTLIEMALEEEDDSLIAEVEKMSADFISSYEDMNTSTLLSGEHDSCDAIVSLHAGAGGTEACDWVAMLFRMYQKYADKAGFSFDVIDYLAGDEAGIKSVTFEMRGLNAYGYMKAEKGVHRLVRISPFDSSGRRHTSFASADVLPDIEEDIDIEIADEDVRIDTYRASGAGGQHINKTDSAIRITHIPTGIVVQCQNERSQHKNKDKAFKMLQIKLLELKRQEQQDKLDDMRSDHMDINFGSQIRSYVMHPYNMVKDHRTSVETGNVNAVMDGDLDAFINGYLKNIALS